jgi:hypothetical protein
MRLHIAAAFSIASPAAREYLEKLRRFECDAG